LLKGSVRPTDTNARSGHQRIARGPAFPAAPQGRVAPGPTLGDTTVTLFALAPQGSGL